MIQNKRIYRDSLITDHNYITRYHYYNRDISIHIDNSTLLQSVHDQFIAGLQYTQYFTSSTLPRSNSL